MDGWLHDRAALSRSQAQSFDLGRDWTRSIDERIAAAFAYVPTGDLEGGASAAERLLSDERWVSQALAPLIEALRQDPAFVPPLRIHRDGLRTLAVLHDGPHGRISASVLSADALAAAAKPTTVVAGGRVSIVRYCRAGGAKLATWDAPLPPGDLESGVMPPCTWAGRTSVEDGGVLRLDGRTRAHLIDGAQADVVMLTVALKAGAATHVREYAREDGRFLRAAELGETESRTRMLLTLLRISGRADAAECFDFVTHEPGFALRWAAMREWLALDVRSALPRLRAMTSDDNAEVRAAALATLALVERRLAA